MSHEPNDLEVRYQNRVVGWLHGFDGTAKIKMISLEIVTATEGGEGFGEPIIDCRVFKLKTMSWAITKIKQIEMGGRGVGDEYAKYCPPYAEFSQDYASDVVRWSWRAVKLADFEEYEWIFDHHCFVPADAPIDFELIKDAVKVTWLEEGAALPDEGTLTAEKLKKTWDDAIRGAPLAPWTKYSSGGYLKDMTSAPTMPTSEFVLPKKAFTKWDTGLGVTPLPYGHSFITSKDIA